MSKLMVEIPMAFLQMCTVFLVCYWLFDFQGNWIMLVLVTWLLNLTAASYAFLVGAFVSTAKSAQELSPLIFAPQLLFAGFFIRIEQIPEWLRWAQYLCTLKYGLNLAILVEFPHGADNVACDPNEPRTSPACLANIKGQEYLYSSNEVDPDKLGFYIGMMVGVFFLFRFLSVLGLASRAKNVPLTTLIKSSIMGCGKY